MHTLPILPSLFGASFLLRGSVLGTDRDLRKHILLRHLSAPVQLADQRHDRAVTLAVAILVDHKVNQVFLEEKPVLRREVIDDYVRPAVVFPSGQRLLYIGIAERIPYPQLPARHHDDPAELRIGTP